MQDASSWQFTTPQGFTLRGQVLGSPGQAVVFFLHGNGFCGGVYEPLLQALRPTFQVVTLDNRDVGGSTKLKHLGVPNVQKALMQSVEDASPRDVSLNVIQKIFTQHPTLERDILAKATV